MAYRQEKLAQRANFLENPGGEIRQTRSSCVKRQAQTADPSPGDGEQLMLRVTR